MSNKKFHLVAFNHIYIFNDKIDFEIARGALDRTEGSYEFRDYLDEGRIKYFIRPHVKLSQHNRELKKRFNVD